MEKKKFTFDEKDIVQNGLLAALYVVLTYVLAPISFLKQSELHKMSISNFRGRL